MQQTPIVTIKSLCKSYGQQSVVKSIDLAVERGECFGLLGPNGAGKTTTLRMLLGMTPPDSGQLTVLGESIPQYAQQMRKRIGVVPQMDNLDPDFTVIENLTTYASYFGLSGHDIEHRLTELLEFARLTTKANAQIDMLSGGMKRRLTLARSSVNNPELLILDEPTTGLDPQARQLIWQRLRELKNNGHTLILTTHYMEEAHRLCDRLAIMDHGKIVTIGSPDELIQSHIETHVIEVYGAGMRAWRDQYQPEPGTRFETLGESLFVYVQDEKATVQDLCRFEDLQFMHRRANLEDVFLKLTGRELRE